MTTFPEQDIGRKIRAFRLGRSMTLEKLATRTKLSKSLLSKIENGKISSPISTLLNIAQALDTKITYFFDEGKDHEPIIMVKKNERQIHSKGLRAFGYIYEALAYKRKEKMMEPFILTVDKNRSTVVFTHPGEELNFILEGKVLFKYGDKEFILEKGDCIYFDSSVPHSGKSATDKQAKTFVVFSGGGKFPSP